MKILPQILHFKGAGRVKYHTLVPCVGSTTVVILVWVVKWRRTVTQSRLGRDCDVSFHVGTG